jgi:hypothetical protein
VCVCPGARVWQARALSRKNNNQQSVWFVCFVFVFSFFFLNCIYFSRKETRISFWKTPLLFSWGVHKQRKIRSGDNERHAQLWLPPLLSVSLSLKPPQILSSVLKKGGNVHIGAPLHTKHTHTHKEVTEVSLRREGKSRQVHTQSLQHRETPFFKNRGKGRYCSNWPENHRC